MKHLFYIVSVMFLLVTSGCGSAVPAGQLGDLLPLEIPTNLAEDVDAIRSAAAVASLSKAVAAGGDLSGDVTRAGDNLHNVTTNIESVLGHLDDFQIGVGESVSQVSFNYETSAVSQAQFGFAATLAIKVDFSDFDIDADGNSEGCSGNGVTAPVCMRLWIDDERAIAAVFTTKPTSSTNGAGRMIIDDTQLGGGDGAMFYGFTYDHTNSSDRNTHFYSGTLSPDEVEGAGIDTHIAIRVQGADDDTAVKTVHYTSQFSDGHVDGLTETQSVVRWIDSGEFFSGSFTNDLADTTINPQCAVLSTGDFTALTDCAAVSVAEEAYVDLAQRSDYLLPDASVFPLVPTF